MPGCWLISALCCGCTGGRAVCLPSHGACQDIVTELCQAAGSWVSPGYLFTTSGQCLLQGDCPIADAAWIWPEPPTFLGQGELGRRQMPALLLPKLLSLLIQEPRESWMTGK